MSEDVYLQVEDAIARKLHLGRAPRHSLALRGMHWDRPLRIERGNIVLENSDCGKFGPFSITTNEWRRRVEEWGLWKKVGIWRFARHDDPTAHLIAAAERNPEWAATEIHRLRRRVADLENGGSPCLE